MGLGIGTHNSPCLYMFDKLRQCFSLSLHNGTFSLRSDILEPDSENIECNNQIEKNDEMK